MKINPSKKLFVIIILLVNNLLISQTSLTLINKYDIGDSVEEPSGLAFDKANNQLFVVSDTNDIYRLSTTGNLLDTYSFSGDLEGISMYNSPNTLLVAIEDTFELVEYNYVTGNSIAHIMDYSNKEDPDNGIEGVTYNPTNGDIYFLNEKDPGALIVANSDFSVTNEYELDFANDYSAAYYVEETNFLWIGSDNSSTISICNIDGSVIETISLTLEGSNLAKLEGIAIDHANQLLYVITDEGQELLVYKINSTLTVNDTAASNNIIMVFPIPVKEELIIKMNSLEKVERILFYNMLGQLVKNDSPTELKINTTNLPSGSYFLNILTNTNNYKKTIIIE